MIEDLVMRSLEPTKKALADANKKSKTSVKWCLLVVRRASRWFRSWCASSSRKNRTRA